MTDTTRLDEAPTPAPVERHTYRCPNCSSTDTKTAPWGTLAAEEIETHGAGSPGCVVLCESCGAAFRCATCMNGGSLRLQHPQTFADQVRHEIQVAASRAETWVREFEADLIPLVRP